VKLAFGVGIARGGEDAAPIFTCGTEVSVLRMTLGFVLTVVGVLTFVRGLFCLSLFDAAIPVRIRRGFCMLYAGGRRFAMTIPLGDGRGTPRAQCHDQR